MLETNRIKEEIRKKFQELFDYSLDFIYIHDLEGNIIDANDIALSTLGYEREDLPKLSFKDILDEIQFEKGLSVLRKIVKEGRQYTHEKYKLKTKDGNFIYIEEYCIPLIKKGEIYAILGIAKNITERVIAEKHLKESVERYRALYENTPFSIVLINSAGEIVDCNPRTVELFGYKKTELIGKEFRKLKAIQLEDLQFLLDLFKRMMGGEQLHRIDLELQKKDGKLIWVNLQASLVIINNETYAQAIFHDIDEHKKADIAMEEELEWLKKVK